MPEVMRAAFHHFCAAVIPCMRAALCKRKRTVQANKKAAGFEEGC